MYFQHSRQLSEDRRLQKELLTTPPLRGGVKDLSKWIYEATKVRIGTTEPELEDERDLFFFKKTRVHEVMEAYALLYRCRWIRYSSGNPTYDLTLGKDAQDSVYAPQDTNIKKRYEAMNGFMAGFERLPTSQQELVRSEQRLKIATLPHPMREALQEAVNALQAMNREIAEVPRPPGRPARPRQDVQEIRLDDDPEAVIGMQEKPQPGQGVREISFSLNTRNFSSTFRWTDYDSKKQSVVSNRPVQAVYEFAPEERFSRTEMILHSALLTQTQVELPTRTWTLKSAWQHLHERYGLRLVAHAPPDLAKRGYSLPRQRLADLLDRLCLDFGGWEWELSPSDFLIFRAPTSPRRRK